MAQVQSRPDDRYDHCQTALLPDNTSNTELHLVGLVTVPCSSLQLLQQLLCSLPICLQITLITVFILTHHASQQMFVCLRTVFAVVIIIRWQIWQSRKFDVASLYGMQLLSSACQRYNISRSMYQVGMSTWPLQKKSRPHHRRVTLHVSSVFTMIAVIITDVMHIRSIRILSIAIWLSPNHHINCVSTTES